MKRSTCEPLVSCGDVAQREACGEASEDCVVCCAALTETSASKRRKLASVWQCPNLSCKVRIHRQCVIKSRFSGNGPRCPVCRTLASTHQSDAAARKRHQLEELVGIAVKAWVNSDHIRCEGCRIMETTSSFLCDVKDVDDAEGALITRWCEHCCFDVAIRDPLVRIDHQVAANACRSMQRFVMKMSGRMPRSRVSATYGEEFLRLLYQIATGWAQRSEEAVSE